MMREDVAAAPDSRPRRVGGFLTRDLGDELLIYERRGDRLHVLNATARELYLLCSGDRSVCELASHLVERFEIEDERAAADVDEAMRELERLGLIELV